MFGSDDFPDDSSEWVELSAHFMGTGCDSPRSQNPGVVMHSTDLSMLCSALEEHLKSATPGVLPEIVRSPDFTQELCAGQFGEWPSRPNMSGPCSLLQSTGANSFGPASSADATPPNSLEGSYIGVVQCSLNDTATNRPWRLRHSSFFQWHFVGWLLRNFPSLFRHFASFLLGATA
ncbi:unnamed protein product [Rodentolepis nana]|uniref:Uncharacterized protein n=1 Tax=Rodentolepis nana TaxID=102285 RepID=A0A0R3TWD0_RODNA|nr:unnamed protein product [Rodentolepis nana]